jgi:hypothetical protein
VSCTREIHYDDYWCHLATSTDVAAMEWPRGTRVNVFAPSANGATNDFARGGVDTGANWSQVSDIPRLTGGSATNVNSATATAVDLYQHAGLAVPDDVVYLIQNVCWVHDNTSPQKLLIDVDAYDITTNDAGAARYALAWTVYANASPLPGPDFDAIEFGIRKETAGGTTLTSEQQFLEVLTGPSVTIEEDLPDPGDPTAWAVTAAFDPEVNPVFEVDTVTLSTGILGFRLGNQGVEINVPETWQLNRIDIGYREEETA